VHVAGLPKLRRRAQAVQHLGSLQYTAPEYFTGDGGSERSDLFALAVITYQMLTGQLPYGLQVTHAAHAATCAAALQPLRAHRPDLPAWLDSVLRQALHPQPARRHEALSQFVHELHHPPQHAAAVDMPRCRCCSATRCCFWQLLSLLLALAVLVLLGMLHASRPQATASPSFRNVIERSPS
jgi:serine/threonine protein kinase